MITTLLANNETKLQGMNYMEIMNEDNYETCYYFFTQVDDADGYNDTIVHINAKFFGNDNFEPIESILAFSQFKGTLAEFDDLLVENDIYVRAYNLKFRFLTSEEVKRSNMPITNFRNKWTDRTEANRYLSSSFR